MVIGADQSGWTFKGKRQGVRSLVCVSILYCFIPQKFLQENLFFINSANITDGHDLSKADEIVPYIQPFPYKGTGYHRHIFILYKQTKKLELANYAVQDA